MGAGALEPLPNIEDINEDMVWQGMVCYAYESCAEWKDTEVLHAARRSEVHSDFILLIYKQEASVYHNYRGILDTEVQHPYSIIHHCVRHDLVEVSLSIPAYSGTGGMMTSRNIWKDIQRIFECVEKYAFGHMLNP